MDLGSLLVLPPYLLDRIRDILMDDIDLPQELRRRLTDVADRAESSAVEASDPDKVVPEALVQVERSLQDESDEPGGRVVVEVEEPPPPIIEIDLVEDLSRWANSTTGSTALSARGIEPSSYSLISLLAGTTVYITPKQLALLKLAENPDKPNPYLPSHLSPRIPTFAGYRALSKQLSTIFNILFSIIGSGAAVFVAAKTGGGYTLEWSFVLGVLASVIVGLAEIVLVWILVWRVDEGRKKEVEQWIGSSAEGSKDGSGDQVTSVPALQIKDKKAEVRLRRRAIRITEAPPSGA